MPVFDITAPDGTHYEVTGPEGSTEHDALAQVIKAHSPAAPSRSVADPRGYPSTVIRNVANAVSMNVADPAMAALGAMVPVKGWTSTKPTYGERYHELLGVSRNATEQGQQENPKTAMASAFAGGFLNPITRALPAAGSIGGATLQGAGIGAAYGAGDAISSDQDAGGILGGGLLGGLTGGILGGALHGAGNIIRGAKQSPDAALLNQNNIPTTIGQDLGGGFKRAEDAATSMPWGGDAIIARQKEGLSGFNRALEDNALGPVGLKVPTNVQPGNEAGKYLKTVNDAAYTHAYNGATVDNTPALLTDLQSATTGMSHRLSSTAKSIEQDIHDNVISRFDPATGKLSTKDFNDAKDWLADQSRVTSNMDNDQRAIANAYGKALAALKRGFSQTDPNRGALLKSADAIYARRMPLVDAAGNTNASAKGGIVTPAQYSGALDRADGSAHGLQYSLGGLPMQDMVQAAQRTLPSSIPDSGTAIRRLISGGIPMAAGAAAGAGALGGPGLAAAGLPMLATRLLYSKTGQDLAKAALFGSPQARAALAKISTYAVPGAFGILGSAGSQTTP